MTAATEERTEGLVSLRTDVPAEVRLELKIQAVRRGVSMRQHITEVLERSLEDKEKLDK